ncbi:sigma-70 family RNA polymerase sigma factor, partial [Longimicrobium sp.]|uniref:sigma-70 family RNA polymerase sigma factor n=1 Tax=Longimicrobium sp. TaxID=2029185 RepID=UPI002E372680
PVLSKDEEVLTARRARAGDQAAADHLVRSNLRFVVMIAKKFQHQGLPLPDLIAEGNRGLLRALPKFDPDIGAKFISYASWWIVRAIQSALREAAVVRPSQSTGMKLQRIRREAARLAQRHRIQPSEADIAEQLGLSVDEVAHALQHGETQSLDSPSGADDRRPLMEHLADPDAPLPDGEAEFAERVAAVQWALSTIPAREAHFLTLYFGLNGEEPMTMLEIAEKVGVSRSRVQQVIQAGLKRLRHASRTGRLAACL